MPHAPVPVSDAFRDEDKSAAPRRVRDDEPAGLAVGKVDSPLLHLEEIAGRHALLPVRRHLASLVQEHERLVEVSLAVQPAWCGMRVRAGVDKIQYMMVWQ